MILNSDETGWKRLRETKQEHENNKRREENNRGVSSQKALESRFIDRSIKLKLVESLQKSIDDITMKEIDLYDKHNMPDDLINAFTPLRNLKNE